MGFLSNCLLVKKLCCYKWSFCFFCQIHNNNCNMSCQKKLQYFWFSFACARGQIFCIYFKILNLRIVLTWYKKVVRFRLSLRRSIGLCIPKHFSSGKWQKLWSSAYFICQIKRYQIYRWMYCYNLCLMSLSGLAESSSI